MTARTKLVAVLARLESPYDGERAAAGLVAARMVRDAGLSWDDLLPADGLTLDDLLPPAPPAAPQPEPFRRRPAWQRMVAECQDRPDRLSAWEQDFIVSLKRQRRLSKKQFAILAKIAGKARAA